MEYFTKKEVEIREGDGEKGDVYFERRISEILDKRFERENAQELEVDTTNYVIVS